MLLPPNSTLLHSLLRIILQTYESKLYIHRLENNNLFLRYRFQMSRTLKQHLWRIPESDISIMAEGDIPLVFPLPSTMTGILISTLGCRGKKEWQHQWSRGSWLHPQPPEKEKGGSNTGTSNSGSLPWLQQCLRPWLPCHGGGIRDSDNPGHSEARIILVTPAKTGAAATLEGTSDPGGTSSYKESTCDISGSSCGG